MSQSIESRSKVHKIEVRRRPGSEGTLQTGATTQVFLDGKLLAGAYFFKFEVHSRKVAKVTIEMFAEVDVDAEVHLGEPVLKNKKGKKYAPYVLSSYGPADPDKI
jgi:hypothetical protein